VKYTVILQPEAVGYSVTCPAVPGAVSQGDTLGEALAMITEAIELLLECMADEGERPLEETPEVIAGEVAAVLAGRREDGLPMTIETCEVEVRLPAAV